MIKSIAKENAIIVGELSQLQDRLKSIGVNKEPQFVSAHQTQTGASFIEDAGVIREKCKQMKAEIDCLNANSILTLPNDLDVRFHVLRNKMKDRISQHREYQELLQSQKQEIHEGYERDKKVKEDLRAIINAAECKLTETSQEKQTKSEVCERTQKKCSTLKTLNKQRLQQMNSFIDKYFPLPDEATFNKVKKKMDTETDANGRLVKREDLTPLKTIVKKLMSACMEQPNDPYITIDHRLWPPYVELLLASSVAMVHPADAKRIKLIPFHL